MTAADLTFGLALAIGSGTAAALAVLAMPAVRQARVMRRRGR